MGVDNKSLVSFEWVYVLLMELQVYLEGIFSGGLSNQVVFDAAIKCMSNGRIDFIGKFKLEVCYLLELVK